MLKSSEMSMEFFDLWYWTIITDLLLIAKWNSAIIVAVVFFHASLANDDDGESAKIGGFAEDSWVQIRQSLFMILGNYDNVADKAIG